MTARPANFPYRRISLTLGLLLCIPQALWASEQCGAYAPLVTCAAGTYAGIDYAVPGLFELQLSNGVNVTNPNADPFSGPDYGAGVSVGGPDDVTLSMLPGNASVISGGFYGIFVYTDDGSAGNILLNANGVVSGGSTGIYAVTGVGSAGSVQVNVAADAVVTGTDGYAVAAYSQAGSSPAPITITTAAGSNLLGSTGILAQGDGGGAISITQNGDIGRAAPVQFGIAAVAYSSGSANVTVNGDINSAGGAIFAGAGGALGDLSITTGSNSTITSAGGTYFGAGIEAVQDFDRFGNPSTGNIFVTHNGTLSASNAMGIYASTSNPLGTGTLDVVVNGSVASSAQAIYVLNSGSGASTLSSGVNATISALSDHALETIGAPSTFSNSGTLSGFVDLSSNSTFSNNASGALNLRNFADSNSDGVRDTQAVSVSMINGDFINAGTLRLSTVLGAMTVDQAGSFTPAGLTAQPIGNGVEQAQLLGVSRFNHSGVITLQDAQTGGAGAVAGDVLLISSATVAGAPGVPAGVFQANGGSLFLDTLLNQGGANSLSDVLVVDSTEVGAGGASTVFIQNAGGLGAPTQGNGIKVVDVLSGSPGSAAGAFALGNAPAAGAFDYQLYRSGPAAEDGDWYLRSALRQALANYASVAPALATMNNAMLGTYHERVGEAAAGSAPVDGFTPALWLRGVHQDIDSKSSAFADTDFESNLSAAQAGVDIWRLQQADARWQVGLSAGYGSMDGSTRANGSSAGNLSSDLWSYGAYATWLGANDSYVDLVAQRNHFDDIDAHGKGGDLSSTTAQSTVLSVEGGYPFALADKLLGQQLQLEPQAQIIWTNTSVDAAQDAVSRVAFEDKRNLLGRLGTRLVLNPHAAEQRPVLWLRSNIWHNFDDGAGLSVSTLNGSSPTRISGQSASTWVELGPGGSLPLGADASVFASASYLHDLDGQKLTGYHTNIGINWRW